MTGQEEIILEAFSEFKNDVFNYNDNHLKWKIEDPFREGEIQTVVHKLVEDGFATQEIKDGTTLVTLNKSGVAKRDRLQTKKAEDDLEIKREKEFKELMFSVNESQLATHKSVQNTNAESVRNYND